MGFSWVWHSVITYNNKELQNYLFKKKSIYTKIQVLEDRNKENSVFFTSLLEQISLQFLKQGFLSLTCYQL